MKKIKNRAVAVLLLAALVALGLGLFVVRLAINGSAWAAVASAQGAGVSSGAANAKGTLTDRHGVVLAGVTDGRRTFADSEEVRTATLHAVGDTAGNIGTGAMKLFASDLIGYNFITGAYSWTGEGRTLALSIDAYLNVEAYKALDGRRGAVMVMDYVTGEVLCMVSSPSFDPADPPKNIDADPAYEGVYLNRAISAAYTPGSVFKLLTAAAAIENIPDISSRVFNCEGTLETGHGTVVCAGVHGEISFKDAFAASCNSAFGEIALILGADTLEEYAVKYGLTQSLTINGVATARGSFKKAKPNTADLAWSGVGQHGDLVCPAAVLRFVGAIANGGVAAKMELIARSGLSGFLTGMLPGPLPFTGNRIMDKDTAAQLGAMMGYNAEKTYGADNYPGLELHAKTGTAEVGPDSKPHSWFAGYITNDGYPLAFVVIVENGGSGASTAGPIANKVLQLAIRS